MDEFIAQVGRYGLLLVFVCRVSLSPDSCVRQTETLFERTGMVSLLFAKFIPGYSTVAPPLAGARFSPSIVVAVKALACEFPHKHDLPLSRHSMTAMLVGGIGTSPFVSSI